MLCPRLAVVAGDEDVRLEIVAPVAVDRDVRGAGVEVRGVDARDPVRLSVARGRPGMFLPTSVNVAPPSRLTWRLPSSVPAHTTPGTTGDSETAMIVLYDDDAVVLRELRAVSRHAHHRDLAAIDLLREIGARRPWVALVVRLEQAIAAQPDVLGLCGDSMNGVFQLKRYVRRRGVEHVRARATAPATAAGGCCLGARRRRGSGRRRPACCAPPPPRPRAPRRRRRRRTDAHCPRPVRRSYRLVFPSWDSV